MCERDVRQGYLTPNHPAQTEEANDRVAMDEGLGFYEVKKYDHAQMKDYTRANLRKEVWEKLGRPGSIKTSPRIVMELDDNNVQRFFFKNLAVLDANNIPRSEAAGLDTTFHKVIEPFIDKTDHSLLNKVTEQEKARIKSMEGTIKEIAEKVGRSESTVQRILGNRREGGSEEEEEMETPEEQEAREAAEEEEHIERMEKAQVEIAKHEDKGTNLEEEEEEEESKGDIETIDDMKELDESEIENILSNPNDYLYRKVNSKDLFNAYSVENEDDFSTKMLASYLKIEDIEGEDELIEALDENPNLINNYTWDKKNNRLKADGVNVSTFENLDDVEVNFLGNFDYVIVYPKENNTINNLFKDGYLADPNDAIGYIDIETFNKMKK